MDTLVCSHVDLVKKVASAIAARLPGHVSHHELIGWGNLGLVDAARRFDPAKSNFTTFAKHRIRGAILDGLRSEDSVSRTDRKRFRRTQDAIEKLAITVGRQPDEEEAARANGLTLPTWQGLRGRFGRMGLIQTHPNITADALPGNFPDAHEAALAAECRSLLDRAIATLPLRYQTVIVLYYRRDLTMREIAGRLGVNESRISQIHHAALGHLRRAIECQYFLDE